MPGGRSRGSFRSVRRRGRSSFSTKVAKAISPINHYHRQEAQRIAGLAADATTGLRCKYFTGFFGDVIKGSGNLQFMVNAANRANQANYAIPRDQLIDTKINIVNGADLRINQVRFSLTTRIINQSNFTVRLVCYKFTPRYHIPRFTEYTSVLDILGRGFAQNWIDRTVLDENNSGLTDPSLSPRQSTTFSQFFKVLSVKSKNVMPGDFIDTSLIDKRTITRRIRDWCSSVTADVIYGNLGPNYEYTKGEVYYLYRVEPAQTGENTGQQDVTSIAPVVHVLTKYNYAHQTYVPFNSYANNIQAGALGSFAASGGDVEIINTETNAEVKEDVL